MELQSQGGVGTHREGGRTAAPSGDEALLAGALTEPPASDALSEKILDAACEQCVTFGLRRSTVDDVARHAKVSRVTVYRRIGSKDDLVSVCLLREYRRFVVDVDDAVAALPTTEDPLVEGFAAVLKHIREQPLVGWLLKLEPEVTLPLLTLESGPAFLAIRGYLAERRPAGRRETRGGESPADRRARFERPYRSPAARRAADEPRRII